MRLTLAFAILTLWNGAALACAIGPQVDVKLDPKDQAALISLGKAVNAQEALNGSPIASLFSAPPGALTLSEPDAETLSKALAGLGKATACSADSSIMERILEDDTPGIRFLRQIEGCLADACVDNP